jgi:hypothetical protein
MKRNFDFLFFCITPAAMRKSSETGDSKENMQ